MGDATGDCVERVDEVDAWVDRHWGLAITVREWWRRLVDAGLAFPAWPAGRGGSGRSVAEARALAAALAARSVVGPPAGHLAENLAAPTILARGRPDQVTSLVRPIALGEAAWCQLFSEPGAGSDLAGVATRAVPATSTSQSARSSNGTAGPAAARAPGSGPVPSRAP